MSSDLEWRRRLRRRVAFGWGRTYSPRGGRATFLLQRLSRYLEGSILDVGAGSNARILGDALGDRYHALDIGESYKTVTAPERSALHYVADLEGNSLPFADAQFGAVLCMDVLEHLDDPHRLLDELFRVSSGTVIVSLPNNWPGFLWSLVAGHNLTHYAGYGIVAQPKVPGQRHKHFFNLEEAGNFLFGRVSREFRVADALFVFEHGNDGLLASVPAWTRWFRIAGKATVRDARERFGAAGPVLWVASRLLYWPLHGLDVLVSALGYSWGARARFYNLFCRQIWVIYERTVPGEHLSR